MNEITISKSDIFDNFKITSNERSRLLVSLILKNINRLYVSNILNEGYRKNISDGTSDHGHGAKIRPKKLGKGNEVFKEKELVS